MFTVYQLVDPRTSRPFYVGVTRDIAGRTRAHHVDPASAAYVRCREIVEAGQRAVAVPVRQFRDKIEAKRLERELILADADLVNSRNPKGLLSAVLYP